MYLNTQLNLQVNHTLPPPPLSPVLQLKVFTLKCLRIGTPKTSNFPFRMVLGILVSVVKSINYGGTTQAYMSHHLLYMT